MLSFGYGDAGIGQGGASNGTQCLVSDHQPGADAEAIADVQEGLKLALLGPLAVTTCTAAASKSRTAKAAHTHESMPPLSRTTARLRAFSMFRCTLDGIRQASVG